MRIGGPVPGKFSDPDQWIAAHKDKGYSAAQAPWNFVKDEEVETYVEAARKADIVISEVGAWSNPISPDDKTRREAIALNQERLAMADRFGARCCVNVAGSRQPTRGPHPENFTSDTFDLIVETVRAIIDGVKPTRTYYTLETMPWIPPDSVDSYVWLLESIDRERFAVHLDPVNLICSPRRYYANADIIRDFVKRLGPHIRSCHAKDTIFGEGLTSHLDEARPGLGGLDYGVFLTEIERLDADMPVMVEHLKTQEEYGLAVDHIRSVAREVGVTIK
jgi:sugar phosphate isomerase/epimerase